MMVATCYVRQDTTFLFPNIGTRECRPSLRGLRPCLLLKARAKTTLIPLSFFTFQGKPTAQKTTPRQMPLLHRDYDLGHSLEILRSPCGYDDIPGPRPTTRRWLGV